MSFYVYREKYENKVKILKISMNNNGYSDEHFFKLVHKSKQKFI